MGYVRHEDMARCLVAMDTNILIYVSITTIKKSTLPSAIKGVGFQRNMNTPRKQPKSQAEKKVSPSQRKMRRSQTRTQQLVISDGAGDRRTCPVYLLNSLSSRKERLGTESKVFSRCPSGRCRTTTNTKRLRDSPEAKQEWLWPGNTDYPNPIPTWNGCVKFLQPQNKESYIKVLLKYIGGDIRETVAAKQRNFGYKPQMLCNDNLHFQIGGSQWCVKLMHSRRFYL